MSTSFLPVSFTLYAVPCTTTQRAFKTRTNQTQGFRVSCNDAPSDHNDNKLIPSESQKLVLPNVDRGNLLVGLGGLYTVANLQGAIAAPITSPDITSICKEANSDIGNISSSVRTRKCCPPNLRKTIKPFVFPTENTMRMRWPAHNGTNEQVEKYKKAIQAMRDLPEDHPHSFNSQAKIHCAYCNGGYTQVDSGFPNVEIQVHGSWLFFPFHRWYLYFYERILGKLINDPTFALPFWKWDEPAGMSIPEIFVTKVVNGKPNSLYDVYQDTPHLPPAIVDLGFDIVNKGLSNETQIACNLSTPTDPHWLNASYVFYDENEELVRVYNKDCVDIEKLKYDFIKNSKEVLPWRKSRPAKHSISDQVVSTLEVPTIDELKLPVSLENTLKVRVKRPAVKRSKEENAKANEILLIGGIKFDRDKFVKFDVFVNEKLKDDVLTTPCDPEYAGGFAQIPHNYMKKMLMSSAARFRLTELLEDTNTDDEEYATVALVPRSGCEDLTVGEVKIKLAPLV
ncbi:putative catechol oxidase [Helianthus annuus]|nr:putative catechol oxidase [Helianthus annuus]KAJ0633411.1 putative catechol oxidase [Helianthus annuus]KAJ0814353.1 putative catechol oxidase [Helianthus annuus]KAJ0827548.1 putative catechol oxidase [Helianthus annuus]